jgi:uncharacterized protein
MTESLVRIITDSPGLRIVKIADGSISAQVIEAIVRVGEREERHVVVNPYPIALDSASQKYIAREITAEFGSQTISFLQENGPGYARIASAGGQCLSAIGVASAVACYMTCWGWDESPSIVVSVNGRSVTMVVGQSTGDGWLQLQGSEAPSAFAPVTNLERIVSIDTLRGVALLGILLINIIAFGLPESAFSFPINDGGHTGLNLAFWYANQIFFEDKMRALFSMLFGAGVVLLTQRAEERGGLSARGIYYRRTLWLAIFGLLHAYFIWIGDILYFYGVVGLVLFPLRKLRPAKLLAAGALLLMIVCGVTTLIHYSLIWTRDRAMAVDRLIAAGGQPTEEQRAAQKEWEEDSKDINPDPAELAKEIKLHRGGYWELFKWRIKEILVIQAVMLFPIVSFVIHDSPGMMLIGMALLKLGVITAERSRKFYLLMILLGYGIGGTLNAIPTYYFARSGFDLGGVRLAWILADGPGKLLVACGHIGLVMLIVKSGLLKWVTSRLAAVGQMALTCYLATSLICTTIFEGYGFGLFARLQRYQLLYVVFSVWLFLLIASPIWLRHFRFGPMEWAWRSLTYWRRQPMKIAVKEQPQQKLWTPH